MAISKVVLNGTTLMDATAATATADDITAPKTAMLADGIMTTGTGGGGSFDILDTSLPAGALISDYEDAAHQIPRYALYNRSGVTSVHLTEAQIISMYGISQCSALTTLVGEKVYQIANYGAQGNAALTAVDMLGAGTGAYSRLYASSFNNCSVLSVLIIRIDDGAETLSATNAFAGTPFASDGTGGTLYVPSALISTYQAATNWSTILSYENNQILSIEGSIYETQYADGIPIT